MYLIKETPGVSTWSFFDYWLNYKMKNIYCGISFLLTFLIMSCHVKTQQKNEEISFRLPEVPVMLVSPEERASYLAVHYWDNFNFSDTALIGRNDIVEQAFVNFFNIIPYVKNPSAAVDTLYVRASVNIDMLYYFIELGNKYLYEPNSPMHNEDLHILVLKALLNNPALSDEEKERPRFLLEMALKNRPGDKAADFDYIDRKGHKGRLSEIKAEYVLLYFNDPECEDCQTVKKYLAESQVLNNLLRQGRLALLSICVEGKTHAWENSVYPDLWIDSYDKEKQLTVNGKYDLKAMPTLYLLDDEHKVIMKDVLAEQIESWFLK